MRSATPSQAKTPPTQESLIEKLREAIAKRNLEECTRLVPLIPNLNAVDPLLEAAENGDLKACYEFAILYKITGIDINDIKNPLGRTPLHLATILRNRETSQLLAELLMVWGADPRVCDSFGWTTLHLAAQAGNKHICELLIDHDPSSINQQDGWTSATPLHLAAYGGYTEVCEFLIRRGANINSEDNSGTTPLHLAAKMGHAKICHLLTKNHLNNINPTDLAENSTTKPADSITSSVTHPLFLAAQSGNARTCEALIKEGKTVVIPPNYHFFRLSPPTEPAKSSRYSHTQRQKKQY